MCKILKFPSTFDIATYVICRLVTGMSDSLIDNFKKALIFKNTKLQSFSEDNLKLPSGFNFLNTCYSILTF